VATEGCGVDSDVAVGHGIAQGGEGGHVTNDATLELHRQHGRCGRSSTTDFISPKERFEIDGH
jgi:hypothetical protein